MARLYTNENFPQQAVNVLRQLGHDVLTTHGAKNSGKGVPDDQVLAFATNEQRAVVTLNRRDFIYLHRDEPSHAGVIVCTVDTNYAVLAHRIDYALRCATNLSGELIRVGRHSPFSAPVQL